MKNKSYNNFFINFANKTKLDIILTLQKTSLSVNEISSKIKEEQSNVSHHLKNLAACKIVSSKKQGKQRIYSLNNKTILPMLKLVEAHAKQNCAQGCSKECDGCANEK